MNNRRLSLFIFIAIVIGLAFPLGVAAKPLIGLFLGLLLFLNFCRFEPSKGNFLRVEILPALLVWLVVMPLFSRALGLLLSPAEALGLYLVAITPAAMGSPVIVYFLRGNFELSVAFVVITSLLAPICIPISLAIAWGDNAVSGWRIFYNVAGLIGIPLVSAILIRQISFLKPAVAKISARSGEVFILLVYAAVATVADRLRSLPFFTLALLAGAALVLALVQFASGYLLSRERPIRFALSIGIGQKNTGLSVWIAIMFFKPEAALVPVLYIIAQHLVSGIMMARVRSSAL
jgi:BASS family bile acid:Na+ symporter